LSFGEFSSLLPRAEIINNKRREREMSTENGFINNEQRKAFALIAERKFNEAETLIRSKSQMLEGDVERLVKHQLGVDVLETLIKAKGDELKEITRKRDAITGTDGYNSYASLNSILGKEKEKVLSLYNLDLRDISTIRSDTIAKIWGSTKTAEALELIERINDIVKDNYKKLDEVKPQIIAKVNEIDKRSLNKLSE